MAFTNRWLIPAIVSSALLLIAAATILSLTALFFRLRFARAFSVAGDSR